MRCKSHVFFSHNTIHIKSEAMINVIILLASLISSASSLENYDFIIAGGGTAGLAVARRLAENGKHSVLVLESGGLPKEGMDVPVYAPRFAADPDVTFRYRSTPQRNAALRNNGVVSTITGRVLSGSSNLNYSWMNRGHPKDWDNWGNITQDSSWNYSNMLKYFKRSETYDGDFPSDQHGYTGPITVSRPKFAPGLEQWLAAGRSLGYEVADANGPQKTSFCPIEFSKRHGRRVSSFVGYIQPILRSTPKLRIILNTNVTQIIFEGKRAIGVRFQSKSHELQGIECNCLYANKEIIVSAGAFRSPLVLLRSGIGPRNVLRASKIPIVRELPVGQNFQDHVSITLTVAIRNTSESRMAVIDEDRDLTPENWEYFQKFGDGPYSATRGATGQAFIVSSAGGRTNGQSDWPNIHLMMSHSIQPFSPSELDKSMVSIGSGEFLITSLVLVVRPASRGTIALNPSDPMNGSPIWDGGYLSNDKDVETMLDGIKEHNKVYEETPSYRVLGARIPYYDIPMCRQFPFRTDDYWRCFIRYASASGGHPVGTCRMGRGPQDPLTVVDTKLRVIGVEGLRVVDASIMPMVTNSNTQAAVYAIAEKASDMILRSW